MLEDWRGELVVSAFTATEADYLILTRLGLDAELSFLEDLRDAYLVDSLDAAGIGTAIDVCRQYRDLRLGLSDASMVVLADRWETRAVATLDHRHFRAIQPLGGGAFELHPAQR